MSPDLPLTDDQRFPGMSPRGWSTLKWMREHRNAPRFNHICGDRLDAPARERIRDYERALFDERESWSGTEIPAWVGTFAASCLQEVPLYRKAGGEADDFLHIPTVSRDVLAREPWSFVPDGVSLENLILYHTSGTTGQPMEIAAHPEFSSKYLPLLRAALDKIGVTLTDDLLRESRVFQVMVCFQRATFTFATVTTYFQECGYIKVNLSPGEWNDPSDRVAYLEECNPLLLGGDPISFAELLKLKPRLQPRALISTAMTLLPALKQELEAHFACPVIDLYASNEAGPLAIRQSETDWEILPHDIFVEILDEEGNTCASGQRGEVVLTGGRNPFLPLLRYRTSDYATLENHRTPRGTIQILKNLEGRRPVPFRAVDGTFINNIDVTLAFRPFPLAQYALHQNKDGSLTLRVRDSRFFPEEEMKRALRTLFGEEQPITFQELEPQTESGKVVCYTSDL